MKAVDAWPESRDARKYDGPFPVVAHPPCQLWGNLANVNFARYGGEHNRPGNDGGSFKAALDAVKKFCGVLKHPADTLAWPAHGLSRPFGSGWQREFDGWICEVWQSAYGHRANKRTWLFYCGSELPAELNWSRPIGTHQVGWFDSRGKSKNKPTLSKREANATPIAFRNALIDLARNARNRDQ